MLLKCRRIFGADFQNFYCIFISNLNKSNQLVLLAQSPLPLTTSSTAEAVLSSDHMAAERSVEYFDKRFDALVEQIERLSSDDAAMRNQIDELIQENIGLKQHLVDIGKINRNEDDDDGAAFSRSQEQQ
jgi:uncharacterized protein (UPF0335 family)